MRMIASIVVGAAIVGLVFLGLQTVMKTSSESQMERECNELITSLSTMVASGDSRDVLNPQAATGDRRYIELELPQKLIYMGFGVDPDSDNDGLIDTGLTSDGECIVYKLEGQSKQVIWDVGNIAFREGKETEGRWVLNEPHQGYIIEGGGEYKLAFENVVESYDQQYVLIRAQDDIQP